MKGGLLSIRTSDTVEVDCSVELEQRLESENSGPVRWSWLVNSEINASLPKGEFGTCDMGIGVPVSARQNPVEQCNMIWITKYALPEIKRS
jgi:hypothetical protein